MRVRLLTLAALAVAAAACASRPTRVSESERAWPIARDAAEREAAAGRFAAADSILTAFAATYPASSDTLDALFWRSVYLADPANAGGGGPAAALPLIDRYLAAPGAATRRYEAELLRRVAVIRAQPPVVRVDTVVRIDTTAARQSVAREFEARDRAREEEALRLRDSLARTVAELERIRARLAPRQP